MKTMKSSFKTKMEIAEILNKPGRFNILTQWVDGGAINCDDNNGAGRTEEEALKEICRRRAGSFKASAPEIITPST